MRQALKKLFGILFFLGLLSMGWFFVQANQERVQLYFWSWRTHEISLGFLVIISLVLGILVSAFLFASLIVASRLEAQRFKRENEAMRRIAEGSVKAS